MTHKDGKSIPRPCALDCTHARARESSENKVYEKHSENTRQGAYARKRQITRDGGEPLQEEALRRNSNSENRKRKSTNKQDKYKVFTDLRANSTSTDIVGNNP